jgi:hypothetical protein
MAQLQRADLAISDSQLKVRKADKLKMRKVVCYWVNCDVLMLWIENSLSLVGREPVKAGLIGLMLSLIMTNDNWCTAMLANKHYHHSGIVCHLLTGSHSETVVSADHRT